MNIQMINFTTKDYQYHDPDYHEVSLDNYRVVAIDDEDLMFELNQASNYIMEYIYITSSDTCALEEFHVGQISMIIAK